MATLAILINFAIAILILWYFSRKPIGAQLAVRSETLSKSISEAKTLLEQAEANLSEWEKNFNQSKAHAEVHFSEAKTSLERQKQNSLANTQIELERLKKEAALTARSERAKSQALIQRELISKSVEMARQILNASLKESDRTALVLNYPEMLSEAAR